MPEKTIRIDGSVHEELQKLKRELGAETFDEVLKRQLGLIPGANEVDKLSAYLPDELQEAVRRLVELIRELGDFHSYVEEGEVGYRDNYELIFQDKDSGYEIACIEFDDNQYRFNFYYRNTKGEWEQTAAGQYFRQSGKEEASIRFGNSGTGVYNHIDLEDVEDTVEQAVSGALQRWQD